MPESEDRETIRTTVAHLSTAHGPHDTRIFVKECRTLAEHGYDVIYVVPHERDEVVEGIRIVALPMPASGRERLTTSARDLSRVVRNMDRKTILHFHDPELLPVAFRARLAGFRVVYDAHEDTPRQVLHLHWIPRPLKPLVMGWVYATEKIAGWTLDAIIAASPEIARRFPRRKTTVVRNLPLVTELIPESGRPEEDGPKSVVYAGGITEARGARQMLEAINLVNQRTPVRLLLAGSFHPKTLGEDLRRLDGWRHVDFSGWVDRDGLRVLFSRASAGLVTLLPTRQYSESLPTKLLEYAAAGLPVVASDFRQIRSFVESAGCGILVDPEDPHAVAEAVEYLLNHATEAEEMGARGRAAVLESWNWDSEALKLLDVYRSVAPARPGTPDC